MALARLLAARPTSAADRELARLVSPSRRSLAPLLRLDSIRCWQPPRRAAATWQPIPRTLMGHSLWRHASAESVALEERLEALGWYEPATEPIEAWTGANRSAALAIRARAVPHHPISSSPCGELRPPGRDARLVSGTGGVGPIRGGPASVDCRQPVGAAPSPAPSPGLLARCGARQNGGVDLLHPPQRRIGPLVWPRIAAEQGLVGPVRDDLPADAPGIGQPAALHRTAAGRDQSVVERVRPLPAGRARRRSRPPPNAPAPAPPAAPYRARPQG